jgi:transcriptional regulator with XRE-family HTH domain
VRGRLEQVLARRLREVAKQKGVALSHLADRSGLARSYMWKLLDGSSSATLAAVQRIAEALDVEPLLLLTPVALSVSQHAAAEARVPKRRKPASTSAAPRPRRPT